MSKTISVIICTKNRLNDFKETIASLAQQSYLPNEVVVVDASENEDICKYLKIVKAPFKFIYVQSKPGLTYQRNIGIEKSAGELLLFFDDDVNLQPEYIDLVVRVFEDDYLLSIGAVGGRISNSQVVTRMTFTFWIKKKLFNILRFVFMQDDFSSGNFRYSGMPTHPHLLSSSKYIECLSGCCMAFRREVFNNTQFDEHLNGYSYMEDADISKQVLDIGYKIYYESSAMLAHKVSPMDRMKIGQLTEMATVNYAYLFKKNWGHLPQRKIAFYWALLGMYLINVHNPLARRGVVSGLKKIFNSSVVNNEKA